jgi:hypothetical protein
VTCPDWRGLDPASHDAAADAALRHLDSGCQRCWQEALALDPTLIFRRLPAPELDAAAEAVEVAAARQAVGAMRAASRLEHRDRRLGAGVVGTASSSQLARWTLAAGLTAMALLFGASHGWHGHAGNTARPGASLPAAAALTPPASGAALPAALGAPGGRGYAATPLFAAAPEALPASSRGSIEGLSRPRARVYQIDGPQMSVVMIVDDKLDV